MRRGGGYRALARDGRGGEAGRGTEFVGEKDDVTGEGDSKMASTEFVGAGDDVTGEGGFKKISKWRRARRSSSWTRGLTSQERGRIFKILKWRRANFVLAPPIGCLRYFGSASVFGPALVNFPDFSYIS